MLRRILLSRIGRGVKRCFCTSEEAEAHEKFKRLYEKRRELLENWEMRKSGIFAGVSAVTMLTTYLTFDFADAKLMARGFTIQIFHNTDSAWKLYATGSGIGAIMGYLNSMISNQVVGNPGIIGTYATRLGLTCSVVSGLFVLPIFFLMPMPAKFNFFIMLPFLHMAAKQGLMRSFPLFNMAIPYGFFGLCFVWLLHQTYALVQSEFYTIARRLEGVTMRELIGEDEHKRLKGLFTRATEEWETTYYMNIYVYECQKVFNKFPRQTVIQRVWNYFSKDKLEPSPRLDQQGTRW